MGELINSDSILWRARYCQCGFVRAEGWHLVLLVLQKEKTGEEPSEAKVVKLYMQIPPIDKMDAALSTLGCCE